MSDFKIDRRGFLKVLGWTGAGTALAGCDLPTTVTLEEGGGFLPPAQGIRRSRGGGLVRHHVYPVCGRVRPPWAGAGGSGREGGRLVPISWDDALALLKSKVGKGGEIPAGKTAWFTGQVSGHQAVLIDEHLKRLGGGRHYAYELVSEGIWQQVCEDLLGDAQPELDFRAARLVVSFGADFLGASPSPVHFAKEFAAFRHQAGDRGVLVVAEPKMTLTGANADLSRVWPGIVSNVSPSSCTRRKGPVWCWRAPAWVAMGRLTRRPLPPCC